MNSQSPSSGVPSLARRGRWGCRVLLAAALVLAGVAGLNAQVDEQDGRPTGESARAQLESRADALRAELQRITSELEELGPVDDPVGAVDGASQDVVPLLRRRCFACHGALRQRSNLRLDSRQAALAGGDRGAAIVPGDAEASLLVRAVRRDGDLEMPPGRALTEVEIVQLEDWIRAGATWPEADSDSSSSPARVAEARAVAVAATRVEDGPLVDFDRDVRPILSNHCYECHGPDSGARQAGLRLDREEGARAQLPSGRHAVVAGDLGASQLFRRIAARDELDRMPPAHTKKPLSTEQVQTLGRWIEQGAPWAVHWAFEPVADGVTAAGLADGAAEQTIDALVRSTLESKSIEPSERADAFRLARRLALDLTGLPPSSAQVESLERAESLGQEAFDRAYRELVDELLASPRYGEHMARYWLDAARYADTNGYHIDNERTMWRWRERVIDAFNDNQPFDQFTIEQLAGDLLTDATLDQQIASGFNRNHMINFEGGAIPEEYRAQYVFDRVDTTGTVWLGLTVGCAKCHDHKYDPISQREYYQLAAFFNTVAEKGLDGQAGNAAPLIEAPSQEQSLQLDALTRERAPLEALLDEPRTDVDRAQEAWETEQFERRAEHWHRLVPERLESRGGSTVARQPDDSLLVGGEIPEVDVITLEAAVPAGLDQLTALRIEALTDESLPKGGLGHSEAGNFVLSEVELLHRAPGEVEWRAITFDHALANHGDPSTPVSALYDGDRNNLWSADFEGEPSKRSIVLLAQRPVDLEEGGQLTVRLVQESPYPKRSIGRFRVAVSGAAEWSMARAGEWWVDGPYPLGVEGQLGPVELAEALESGRRRWNVARLEDAGLLADPVAGLTRFYRVIEAPSARAIEWRIQAKVAKGSTGAVRVVLNGEELVDEEPIDNSSGASGDSRRVAGRLRAGSNQLLIELKYEASEDALEVEEPRVLVERTDEAVGFGDFRRDHLLWSNARERSDEDNDWVRRHFRRTEWSAWREHEERFVELSDQLERLREQIPTTMVMGEMDSPRPTFVLKRGLYDQMGERVEAATPSFLPPMSGDLPRNRLGLARWLVSDDNPLTARVQVNRVWQRLFGSGLVRSSEDFGAQGTRPSHPQLLDWLARSFVESGWDTKQLIRTIVTSETYQQSSKRRMELAAIDPDNRLLARGPRYRLDAEVIRDTALEVSGLLRERIGGPSVRPYGPEGMWKLIGYGAGNGRFSAGVFEQDRGDSLYRRSLYTFWKRTVPPPNMTVFDAPNREYCVVERSRSNTPLQALTLLNDPTFVEAARVLAERLFVDVEEPAAVNEQSLLSRAFETVLSRAPTAEESAQLLELLDEQRRSYREAPGEASSLLAVGESPLTSSVDEVELAAWTTVTSVILNLDEAISKM